MLLQLSVLSNRGLRWGLNSARNFTGRKYALLKLKILLSTILRNFRVYSDVKEDDYRLQGDIILKRADGFMIKLEPRRKNLMASLTV
jgi:cytochrome P450 family 4